MATVALGKNDYCPSLLVFKNGKIESVKVYDQMKVGRGDEHNFVDIDLPNRFVSREHGVVGTDDSGVYYVDTDSTNGTYYNGNKLSPRVKQYLCDGDVLHIFNGTPTSEGDFVCLIFSASVSQRRESDRIELDASMAEINIGRDGDEAISVESEYVSENHASFFTAARGWAVVDHDSTNGVFLNNERIDRAKYICIGDCIRIADINFIFVGDAFVFQKNITEVDSGALEIRISERSVWQRAKKLMLLQNINMKINAGEMVLILGGSGAGKTTFMNAVMGYEKADGKIRHGNVDIYEDFESMKHIIGFVPQQDLLRGHDTVYSTLNDAAKMKVDSLSRKDRNVKVAAVLDTLGLTHARKSLVSKLSGGQRKRLSIAVEYIADPKLFFLDEPDSGLDGPVSRGLMQNLRHIANEGKIVMVISHIPDRVSDLFDKVIVLAKSEKANCGHLAFYGGIDEAMSFFEAKSLEDVVRKVNRKDEGGEGLADHYVEQYKKYVSNKHIEGA